MPSVSKEFHRVVSPLEESKTRLARCYRLFSPAHKVNSQSGGMPAAAMAPLVVQEDGAEEGDEQEQSKETAHRIGKDPWWQVSFLVFTGFNGAYVLGYSKIIMAYLGWTFGVLSLIITLALALYSYQLLASLHYAGGRRRIRYRDLTGQVYGYKMYITTWLVQHIHLFLLAIGYVILAGQSLKGLYTSVSNDTDLKLPHWISISGGIVFLFAFSVPHLSALRVWLGLSTAMTLLYLLIVVILTVRDGQRNHARDYSVHGSTAAKVFNGVGALTNIVFSYGCTILPELQATVKEPAIKNMKRALYIGYASGSALMYIVTLVGYWAYGSQVSSYLLDDVSGSRTVIAVANLAVFIQTIISIHAFSSPIYEFWDTRFARMDEGQWSVHNMLVRFVGRGLYSVLVAFFAAFLPFIGDFSSLTGATSTIPLTFVLPNHMYITVKKGELSPIQIYWHYFNVIFFTLMILFATVSSLRSIVVDFGTYHVFANI